MEISNEAKTAVLKNLIRDAEMQKYSSTIQAKISYEVGNTKAEEAHKHNATELQKFIDGLEKELKALDKN